MIMQNANECVNWIVKHLKKQGMMINKNYEKKRKLFENEDEDGMVKEFSIHLLIDKIKQYEDVLAT